MTRWLLKSRRYRRNKKSNHETIMNNNKRQIYFRAVKVKFVSVPRQPTSDVRSMCVRARCVCESLLSFYDARWHPLGVMRKGGIFDISRLPREIFATVAAVGVCLSRSGLFFGCRPRTELGKRIYLSSVCLLNRFGEFLGACRNINRISPARRLWSSIAVWPWGSIFMRPYDRRHDGCVW